MQFSLQIKLDNAEVDETGVDQAVPAYLRQVAGKIELGHTEGIVWDGNGNNIGQYAITD